MLKGSWTEDQVQPPHLMLLYLSHLCPLLSRGTVQGHFFRKRRSNKSHPTSLWQDYFPGSWSETLPLSHQLFHVDQVYPTPGTKSTSLEIQNEVRRSPERWLSPHRQHSSSSALPLPGISLCLAFHEPHLHKGELLTPGIHQIKAWKGKYFCQGSLISSFVCPGTMKGGKKKEEKACTI